MKVVALRELVEFTGGGTPRRDHPEYWGGSIPWVSCKDLNGSLALRISVESITEKGLQSSASNLIPSGTLLVATRMSLGKAVINEIPVAINQDLKAITCKPGLDVRYLLWFWLSQAAAISRMGSGATVKGITLDQINELKIPVPPLGEQKRIAAILDKADAIRRKRFAALELENSLIASLFFEHFGDPVSNSKKWRVVKLGDACSKITDGVHARPTYVEQGIPFISVKDITTGRLRLEDCKYISATDHAALVRRCRPESMDILYTKVGATYGRPALVDTDREFSLYVSVALVKPRRDLVNPYFMKELLGTPLVKRQADKCVKGAGVPDLHLVEIKNFSIPLPPLQVQDKFVALLKRIHRIFDSCRDSSKQAETLFSSLFSQAFKK